MTRMIAISFLAAILFGGRLGAERTQAVAINIGTIPFGNFELSYERRLSERFSISTSVAFYQGSLALWRIFSDGTQVGASFLPKVHLYGTNSNSNSFYVAPSIRLGYLTHPARNENELTDRGLLSRFGLNFGYQHIFNNGIYFELLTGIEHYHTFSFTEKATRFQTTPVLIRPYHAISIGYAF